MLTDPCTPETLELGLSPLSEEEEEEDREEGMGKRTEK